MQAASVLVSVFSFRKLSRSECNPCGSSSGVQLILRLCQCSVLIVLQWCYDVARLVSVWASRSLALYTLCNTITVSL
jgi:hypothetical protein